MAQQPANPLGEQIYLRVKAEIFDFHLLPGDRFTETELAARLGVSRTPIRDALYRLRREGYLEVGFRSGWSVAPFDFVRFDELYDLRILIESHAVEKLCALEDELPLAALKAAWLVPVDSRESDPRKMAGLDEAFHCALVEAAGNREMQRVHQELTEKIRIIRRLDFLKENRIAATYDEHAKILRLIMRRKATEALILLRSHITQSKSEVRKITLHMLHDARGAMLRTTEAAST
ncbi:MAG: GntR family transcriptional regulator [Gammaproteobacteria bacterium]|jgi:DNA-binding GntR family transcriptional regulator|uniref:GntR family transcriptional regulator n=1 Tax=Nevskia sp. TaxID=1929292 RepID=UPI00403563D0|nr:GntR family transcriptional regulator [Gammaproteobacteria bacterium]